MTQTTLNAQDLIDQLPPHKSYLLDGCESIEAVHYEGDVESVWASSHKSYYGFRVVALRCVNDGDEYEILFFDHENDGIYTFVIVQFTN